jgi:diketogulonate reductase-like aldo/keto reductase
MAATTTIRTTALPSGERIPVLGQGTWHFAERPERRKQEIAALQLGLDLGMRLIDTAEMYADGGAEELVGHALRGRRDDAFVVSKVLPDHATRPGTIAACEASLVRLGTDWLDLYLLHWRGAVPLQETVSGFLALQSAGMIRHWGVSNFDLGDLTELLSIRGGRGVQTDQVLYNLQRRGIEWDLLPWCTEHGLPIMAYSPIEQGRMLGHPVLRELADRHDATPAQVALAWVLSHERVVAIPRASRVAHVVENRTALDLRLDPYDRTRLNEAFPPPSGPRPLEVL